MQSLIPLALALAIAVALAGQMWKPAVAPSPAVPRRAARVMPGTDHARLPALARAFSSPREVTDACVSCHTQRGHELLASAHFRWLRTEPEPGRGARAAGKRNVLNNFCIGVTSNERACTKCHAGAGYVDGKFDFDDSKNVDCLVCHAPVAAYARGGGGAPEKGVDLGAAARQVRRPRRENCGACHFHGGGGNNVKHGDLESALLRTTREVDVHMGADGGDMECVDCHRAPNHRFEGKLYSVSSMDRDRARCTTCHGETPHRDGLLDAHTAKVACQTCHIPAYAKVNPTKVRWDWSTAARLKKPFSETDAHGDVVYTSQKGSFTWGRDLAPEYAWFDGTAAHQLLGDRVGPERPVAMNRLGGAAGDPRSRIVPVKVHRGRQPYDPVGDLLIQPKLVGAAKGEGALWMDFDWTRAAQEGMKAAGLPFSGRVEFVETTMSWPLNHMVAPKERALACAQCHTREGSRIAGVTGVYVPGRDRNPLVERIGVGLVLLSLAGVLVHALARIARRRAVVGGL